MYHPEKHSGDTDSITLIVGNQMGFTSIIQGLTPKMRHLRSKARAAMGIGKEEKDKASVTIFNCPVITRLPRIGRLLA